MTSQLSQDDIAALGPGFVVDTFDQLWTAIGRLPFVSQDGPYAWRGVPDSAFRIQSSLHRELYNEAAGPVTEEDIRRAEVDILDRARNWRLGGVESSRVTDIQLLATLQHHGAPTRLLDVTANPLTALWFACASEPATDGLLIAFNVAEYRTVNTEKTQGTAGRLDDPLGFDLTSSLQYSTKEQLPFLVKPSFLDARMAAQEGYFLASACPIADQQTEYREVPRAESAGLFLKSSDFVPAPAAEHMLFDPEPEFTRYPQALWCFVIAAEMKQKILPVLESSFNRTASVLFPDYAGFRAYGLPDDRSGK